VFELEQTMGVQMYNVKVIQYLPATSIR
jgi:hypothetical protein